MFDIWLERFAALKQRPLIGVVVGLILFACAFSVRQALGADMAHYPFLTFFPAILLTAVIGGMGPAILVAVLSALSAWYFFIPPFESFAIGAPQVVGLAFFSLVAALDIALIEALRNVLLRLVSERQRAQMLLDAREAMFKELQHRVSNNMQFVSSLLAMEQRRFAGTPAGDALEQAAGRLRAMSRIHRRLYDPAQADREFGPLVEDLCHELLQATGAKNIVCRVNVPPVTLPMDRVVTLTLIVNEALTNAVKHAFPDGDAGTIRITLERITDAEYALTVADDGRGLPEGFDAKAAQSLGMRIFHALANQLQGVVSFVNTRPGLEMRLRFQA